MSNWELPVTHVQSAKVLENARGGRHSPRPTGGGGVQNIILGDPSTLTSSSGFGEPPRYCLVLHDLGLWRAESLRAGGSIQVVSSADFTRGPPLVTLRP